MSRRRGVYRGVYSVLLHDLDFRRLSPRARHVLLTMRLSDYVGIACFWRYEPGALADQTGYPQADLDGILTELEGDQWVQRDGGYMWITNGLRHDPTVSMDNPNHKTAVLRHIAGLPRLTMLRKFCRYYDLPYPFESHRSGYTNGTRKVVRSPSPSPRRKNTETEKETPPPACAVALVQTKPAQDRSEPPPDDEAAVGILATAMGITTDEVRRRQAEAQARRP